METLTQTYVNPLSDWGFKRLFGTERNKDLLVGLLRSILPERDIADISYLGTERRGLSERERDSVFDVMCAGNDGTQFVVEMQKRTQKHFRDRALYYAAHPIAGQAPKGPWDYRLKPVCVVGILGFAMEHDYGSDAQRWREKLVHRYRLREDETGEIMNSKLEFIYLEAGAYRKEAREARGMVEKWMYALKNLPRLAERPRELGEEVFGRLFEAARIAGYTREERNQYENDMMNENDYRNTIEYAREEGLRAGLAEGLAEGEAKGREAGITEAAMHIAKNLLASGMPEEQVISMTGLTAGQLAGLK